MQDNIISLLDENGVESQFEVILTLEAENKEYAILMPVDDEEAEEALVFRIDQDEEGEMLVPLEDDKEYEIVVDVYNTLMDAKEFALGLLWGVLRASDSPLCVSNSQIP